MKEFFRSMLGSCLGIILAVVLFFVVIIGIGLAAAKGDGGSEKLTKENGVLKLNFSNAIPEKTNNMEQDPFSTSSTEAIGLRDYVLLIENAAKDNKIKGISLNLGSLNMGQSTMLQIRDALEKFRESKKFIYSYADFYSQGAYMLASVSDSIFMNPNGGVDLHGLGTTTPFFKNTLDKIGVDFNVFYAGDFKSATEPFRRTDMSPENKMQTKEFLEDMLNVLTAKISKSRKISEADLDRIMSGLEGRNEDLSLKNKLVDGNVYWDQYENKIRKRAGLNGDEKINYLSISDYNSLAELSKGGSYKNKIAVVYAEGEVGYNNPKKGSIDNKRYLKIFDQIKRDDKIKAVVLRVNSGGGSALTSDIIWREVELLKNKNIPVYASFGDYAASGGYYIAAGAEKIYAAPNTLTGSIGVFSMFPNVKKLMTEKAGITFDTVKTHAYAVNLSTVYALSDFEKKVMTESTDDIYQQFLERVASGRKMTKEDVHKIAQGRVWTGNKAKEIGLVDEIGYLNDAITAVAKKAKIDGDFKVVEYPKISKSMFEEVLTEIAKTNNKDEEETKLYLNKEAKFMYDFYKRYQILLSMEGVQARNLIQVEW